MKKLILFLLIIITLPTFGQIKLSQLTETTTLNTNDLFLVSKGTASRKLQFTNLRYSVLNPIPFALRMNYLSDSLRTYFSADSTMFNTNNSFFKFNKPIYANGVLLGSGGGALSDGIWKYSSGSLNPYTSFTANSFYNHATFPTGIDSLKLDRIFSPTGIFLKTDGLDQYSRVSVDGFYNYANDGIDLSYSSLDYSGLYLYDAASSHRSEYHPSELESRSLTGDTLFTWISPLRFLIGKDSYYELNTRKAALAGSKLLTLKNNDVEKAYVDKDGGITGATVTANGGSTYGVIGYSTSSNAGNFQLNSSGSNSSDAVIVQRNMSGTANASGDLLKIYENSTSSGTLGGNFISGYWGAVQKFSIDKDGFISHKGCFASIYRNGSGADQSIPTGTTPTKITAFTTNGYASNCTADATNDKITITKTGYYDLNLSLSYSSGTANVTWTAYIFNGGSEVANIHSRGKAVTANDIRSTAITGIMYVSSVPADIDYRVSHDNGGSVNLNISYANLKVTYLGD